MENQGKIMIHWKVTKAVVKCVDWFCWNPSRELLTLRLLSHPNIVKLRLEHKNILKILIDFGLKSY